MQVQVQVQVQVQRSYGVRSSAGCEAQVPASARRGAVACGSLSGWRASGASLALPGLCTHAHKLVGGNVNLA